MECEPPFTEVIEAINELKGDNTVPKNVKAKLDNVVALLNEKVEDSIKISRVLHEIEEISEDSNMQSYTRTQIFNVVSLLEMIK
jgi:uncharacterized protein (UPF0147 family)